MPNNEPQKLFFEIVDLKNKMIQKAQWINSPKCKHKENPRALLTHIMSGELETKLPNSRASPA